MVPNNNDLFTKVKLIILYYNSTTYNTITIIIEYYENMICIVLI